MEQFGYFIQQNIGRIKHPLWIFNYFLKSCLEIELTSVDYVLFDYVTVLCITVIFVEFVFVKEEVKFIVLDYWLGFIPINGVF